MDRQSSGGQGRRRHVPGGMGRSGRVGELIRARNYDSHVSPSDYRREGRKRKDVHRAAVA
ncbi:hypothetical protein BCAR13_110131 [Paraburkholderia caribensis]|nr:hypothetical protein BCAR13_110131 [Paraburkholderia caribensis]